MISKLLLAFGAKYDNKLEKFNIITAFLESNIKKSIYIE